MIMWVCVVVFVSLCQECDLTPHMFNPPLVAGHDNQNGFTMVIIRSSISSSLPKE